MGGRSWKLVAVCIDVAACQGNQGTKWELVHPRLNDLSTRLRTWRTKYRGTYIGKVSDRLLNQITISDMDLAAVREQHDAYKGCGYILCENTQDMLAWANCRIQLYCSPEHRRKDWKNHEHICNKGLIEAV